MIKKLEAFIDRLGLGEKLKEFLNTASRSITKKRSQPHCGQLRGFL